MGYRNHGFFHGLPLACFLVLMLGHANAAGAARSVNYTKTKIAGVHVNVVTADLNNSNVCLTPAISRYGMGTCESFRSMLRRTRPAAAINGTFFCTRSLLPTGDIVIDRRRFWRGCLGTAVAVDAVGQVHFIPTRGEKFYRWWEYDHVIAAGPSLVLRGKTTVVPKAEGFRSNVHFSKRSRAAVGLTYHNKLVLVTTRQKIYYRQLAAVMKHLKCVDAAVLDGGSSIGLYWKGKLIMNPGRGLTNCLMIYDDPYSYERSRSCMYPVPRYSGLAPADGWPELSNRISL